MQTKIFLDDDDRIHGSGQAITIAVEDTDMLAIFFPLDPEQKLRVCDQIAEALDQVRHDAFSNLAPRV